MTLFPALVYIALHHVPTSLFHGHPTSTLNHPAPATLLRSSLTHPHASRRRRLLRIRSLSRELDRKPCVLRPRQTIKLDIMLNDLVRLRIHLLVSHTPNAILDWRIGPSNTLEQPEEDEGRAIMHDGDGGDLEIIVSTGNKHNFGRC